MPLGRLRRSVEVRPRPKRNGTAPQDEAPRARPRPHPLGSGRAGPLGPPGRAGRSCGRAGSSGRGPDSEPLVAEAHPLAWLSAVVIAEAGTDVTRKHDGWGTLRRATPPAVHEGS
ncbi:DUF6098 family protein [Actinacidiphila glaucinigra]|uniref:DUF6098 family protein n=1 Tax=Actinacidiphila glaucinigra TaxID=235986 RepID=UPI0038287C03